MKLYEKYEQLLSHKPWPNDVCQQLQSLADQAKGQEKQFIVMGFEAFMSDASPEQLAQWNPEPTAEQIARWEVGEFTDAELAEEEG